MNLKQAGYRMLMILAASSGYDTKEGKVVMEFLKAKITGEIDFELEAKFFKKLKSNQIADVFREAALHFRNAATESHKRDFLVFCLELASADGEATPEENRIIASLAKNWSMNLETLFD